MRLLALIFDWDQTLLDSWSVHRDAIWHAATSLGLDPPREEEAFAFVRGMGPPLSLG